VIPRQDVRRSASINTAITKSTKQQRTINMSKISLERIQILNAAWFEMPELRKMGIPADVNGKKLEWNSLQHCVNRFGFETVDEQRRRLQWNSSENLRMRYFLFVAHEKK
jgi:hypothetical protein